jgi:hypothetical protein
MHEIAEGFSVSLDTALIMLALQNRAHRLGTLAAGRSLAGPDHRERRAELRAERQQSLNLVKELRDGRTVVRDA